VFFQDRCTETRSGGALYRLSSLGMNYRRAVMSTSRLLRRNRRASRAPIEGRGLCALSSDSHLGRVGLYLMLAGFAPDD
jgi:hypothetical protein